MKTAATQDFLFLPANYLIFGKPGREYLFRVH
jgi:hypothetical protein